MKPNSHTGAQEIESKFKDLDSGKEKTKPKEPTASAGSMSKTRRRNGGGKKGRTKNGYKA